MANHLKRRSSDRSRDDDLLAKKQRLPAAPMATASELVQAINLEWSRARALISESNRSKSCEPFARNVSAKMTVDLLSSNPEPTTFLMGTIANELENISQMLSADTNSRVGASGSPSSSRSHSSPSSTSSSPDYYDRLVMRGHEMLESMRQDPDLVKYL